MSSVTTSSCPKCSFEYEAESECQRCGIIFDRYKPSPPAPPAPWVVMDAAPVVPDLRWFRKSWHGIQWAMVAVTVIAVVLILQESSPPKVSTDPQAILINMVARVFESPEQREQFQLPKDIARTCIRDEELVISSFP